jgi:predicted AAA+ superfamily ATPase
MVTKRLENNPVVALLGARQVGKSTLAKLILQRYPNSLYLDLELRSDRAKVENDPEMFFRQNPGRLICLDEIQRLPEIFTTLRSVIDQRGQNAQFLILGSASRDLIQQSSESLAGRISYLEVGPFLLSELAGTLPMEDLWIKGGYPRSVLQMDLEESVSWRQNYIRTFLERDIAQLGFSIPARNLERLWTMLAHQQGQVTNYSSLGKSLGVSHHTIKNYIDILEQTFVLRTLPPFHSNQSRRLIKTPKTYIRDTGLLHSLIGIETINDLLGHPIYGSSFETFILENIIRNFPTWKASYFRDSMGNEIDLILEKGSRRVAIEIKASTAPSLEKGFWNAQQFLKPQETYVIANVEDHYPGPQGILISSPEHFLQNFQ